MTIHKIYWEKILSSFSKSSWLLQNIFVCTIFWRHVQGSPPPQACPQTKSLCWSLYKDNNPLPSSCTCIGLAIDCASLSSAFWEVVRKFRYSTYPESSSISKSSDRRETKSLILASIYVHIVYNLMKNNLPQNPLKKSKTWCVRVLCWF